MNFKKNLLTASSILTFCSSTLADYINIDNRRFFVDSDYNVTYNNTPIEKTELLQKAIKTQFIFNEAKKLKSKSTLLEILDLLSKGQELNMKYTDYIEWALTFPAKALVYTVEGKVALINELINIGKEELRAYIKNIKDSPEKHAKNLAYLYYSKAQEKFKENKTIINSLEDTLDFETATKLDVNADFIYVYANAAQNLYWNVLNQKPLEKRWLIAANEAGSINIINKEDLEKILNNIKQDYSPLNEFIETTNKRREELTNIKKERWKRINDLIKRKNNVLSKSECMNVYPNLSNNKEAKIKRVSDCLDLCLNQRDSDICLSQYAGEDDDYMREFKSKFKISSKDIKLEFLKFELIVYNQSNFLVRTEYHIKSVSKNTKNETGFIKIGCNEGACNKYGYFDAIFFDEDGFIRRSHSLNHVDKMACRAKQEEAKQILMEIISAEFEYFSEHSLFNATLKSSRTPKYYSQPVIQVYNNGKKLKISIEGDLNNDGIKEEWYTDELRAPSILNTRDDCE